MLFCVLWKYFQCFQSLTLFVLRKQNKTKKKLKMFWLFCVWRMKTQKQRLRFDRFQMLLSCMSFERDGDGILFLGASGTAGSTRTGFASCGKLGHGGLDLRLTSWKRRLPTMTAGSPSTSPSTPRHLRSCALWPIALFFASQTSNLDPIGLLFRPVFLLHEVKSVSVSQSIRFLDPVKNPKIRFHIIIGFLLLFLSLGILDQFVITIACDGGCTDVTWFPSFIQEMRPMSIKQVIIQSEVQLELVRQEIRISSPFSHLELLPRWIMSSSI